VSLTKREAVVLVRQMRLVRARSSTPFSSERVTPVNRATASSRETSDFEMANSTYVLPREWTFSENCACRIDGDETMHIAVASRDRRDLLVTRGELHIRAMLQRPS